MKKAMNEEIRASELYFHIVQNVPELKTKIPTILKLGMQWLLRGGGHSYMFPSGTIHGIGGLYNGIVCTHLIINKCTICEKYKSLFSKVMEIRKKCRSISSPCYACVNAIETKKTGKGCSS